MNNGDIIFFIYVVVIVFLGITSAIIVAII